MGQPKTLLPILLLSGQLIACFGLSIVPEQLETLVAPTPASTTPATSAKHLEEHQDLEKSLHNNITSDRLLKLIRPVGEDGVTHVQTNIYVRDIQLNRINPEDKALQELYHWTADITLRQKWNDKRLSFDHEKKHPEYKYFPLNTPKSIWTPDLFFTESVSADFHYVTAPNTLIWIYPNGDILYSLRLTAKIRCQKSVNSASPTLVCPMRLASYAYTTEELDLKWDVESPIQIRDSVYIPHFELEKVTTESSESKTKIGSFSTITANFHFKPEE